MVKAIFIKKEKLKNNASRKSVLTSFDAKESARKAEQILKANKNKPTEFIEVGE